MTETDTIATAAAATPAAEEATDLAALAELTAQRSAVYRLLARLYRVEVDEEFLTELKAMRFPAATGNTAVDAATAPSPPTCPAPTPTPSPIWPSITCVPSSAMASMPTRPPTPSSRCTRAPSAS